MLKHITCMVCGCVYVQGWARCGPLCTQTTRSGRRESGRAVSPYLGTIVCPFVCLLRCNSCTMAMSSALGDIGFKRPLSLVTSEPEVSRLTLNKDALVILACDGLWDVVTSDEACAIAKQSASPQAASEALVQHAYRKGSTDNISVMVVRLMLPEQIADSKPAPAARL